jgi:trehalose 6-phosphate phosphatase
VSHLDFAIECAASVLVYRPSGLVSDIDGTLSRIAARPEDAFVSKRVRDALERLQAHLDLVGVLTAREEPTARSMVGIDSLTYIGNYALDNVSAARVDEGETTEVRQKIEPLLKALPGVQLEEKGISFALHYRNTEDPDLTRLRLLALVEPMAKASGTRVVEGKKVVEVVPASLPTKATAIERLIDENALRGVVYLGDDIADVSVFRELRRRNETEAGRCVTIAVTDEETDPAVRNTADLALNGVDEVEAFLEGVAEAMGRKEWQ